MLLCYQLNFWFYVPLQSETIGVYVTNKIILSAFFTLGYYLSC